MADLMTGTKPLVNPTDLRLPRFADDSQIRSHTAGGADGRFAWLQRVSLQEIGYGWIQFQTVAAQVK